MAQYFAYDIKAYFDPGSGSVLLGQVRDIDGPGMTDDIVDVSTRDDSGNKTYISGIRSPGAITLDVVYDPDNATQATLTTALASSTIGTVYLVIDALTETGWYAEAAVTAFKPKAPLGDAFAADVTFDLMASANELAYLSDAGADYMVISTGGDYWIV